MKKQKKPFCSTARWFPAVFALCMLAASRLSVASAAEFVQVVPETVGMSSERLALLDEKMMELIEQEKLPGCVSLVMRDGKVVHFSALGYRNKENQVPMQKDSLFRIASQTKAIVSVAVMMLQEDGLLNINDAVGKYMPEFMQTNVAQAKADGGYEIVPAKRAITIRDLLTHTSGVSYGYGLGEDLWQKAGIQEWYFANRDEPIRDVVRRMANLPFQAQPGEQWIYGYNTDILGALVEVVSGETLDVFLKSRIFDPVGMSDTHFFLPDYKASRLATVYSYENGRLFRAPDKGRVAQGEYVEGPRKCFSGGAGLVSSAHDYAAFLQMLEDEGVSNGVRILSRKTVELMRINHLQAEMKNSWTNGTGFGLGFSVVTNLGLRGELGSVGEYGWGGAYHSSYWIDPKEKLVVVYFTQVIPAQNLNDHQLLRNLIYQAIAD